jgi:hypothetical protein
LSQEQGGKENGSGLSLTTGEGNAGTGLHRRSMGLKWSNAEAGLPAIAVSGDGDTWSP